MRRVFKPIYLYEELQENGIKFDSFIKRCYSWKTIMPWLTVGTIYVTADKNAVIIRKVLQWKSS